MTRKDYILIAEALRKEYTASAGKQDTRAALLVSDVLEKDNPRFDCEHFLAVVRGEREL